MENFLFHPRIVHLPIALAVLILLLGGGVLLAWWRAALPRGAWWLVVAAQLLLVGSGFLALESGEEEEERVEEVVPHDAIHEHEEAAEAFFYASLITLLPLAIGVLPVAERIRRGGALAGVVASVLGLGYRVGEAGGALVYTHNAGAAYVGAPGSLGGGGGEHEEHEDDD